MTISKQEEVDRITLCFRFELLQLEAELMQRTFEQEVMLRLGGIQLKQHHNDGEIYIVNTPMSSGSDEYLIVIQFINVSILLLLLASQCIVFILSNLFLQDDK